MSAKKRNPAQKTPTFGPRDPRPKPFAGLVFLILGLLVALAVANYNWMQVTRYGEIQDQNLIGIFGAHVGYYSLKILGLAGYALPVLPFWLAYVFFRPFPRKGLIKKLLPVSLIFLSLAVFGAMFQIETAGNTKAVINAVGAESAPLQQVLNTVAQNDFPYGWGGWNGFHAYAGFLYHFLGMVGSLVVFGVLSAFSLVFLLFDNLGRDARNLVSVRLAAWVAGRADRAAARRERRELKRLAREQQRAARRAARLRKAKPEPAAAKEAASAGSPPPSTRERRLSIGRGEEARPFDPIFETEEPLDDSPEEPARTSARPAEAGAAPKPIKLAGAKNARDEAAKGAHLRIIAGEETRKAQVKLPEKKGNYKFPPMRLLPEPIGQWVRNEPDLRARRRLLCDHLASLTDGQAIRAYKRLYEPDFGALMDLY